MIIKDMNLSGKAQAVEFLQQQEQMLQAQQQESQNIQHTFEEAKLKEMYARTAAQIATAKERYGRFESNIGLLEERMAEVSKNRALSTKAKMEALNQLVDIVSKFGEIETSMKLAEIQSVDDQARITEEREQEVSRERAASDEFLSKLTNNLGGNRVA